jgi:hypothetical protein
MDSRLVLVTDLGILAKIDARGEVHVFVQSIRTGRPSAGTMVEILGKNGIAIMAKRTDALGHVAFPTLDDFRREKSPVAIVARAGDDFSFLPYERSERELKFSRFDIGGVFTGGQGDKLSAYLFSDRGIYRPGDTFHTGIIVKAADWRESVDGVPLQVTVTDPRGMEVRNERLRLPESGFLEFEHTTEESSPTGGYTVTARLVRDERPEDILGSTSVRVEEFLPDSMRISAYFTENAGDGWISPRGLKAKVALHNLFGTPAADRRVTGEISLSVRYPSFKGYRDYKFYDPLAAKESHVESLGEMTTDAKGEAVFDIDLSKFKAATYSLMFLAEGFEAGGGRSVSAKATTTVSPLSFVVGYKTDGGELAFLPRDSERKIQFIALNSKLEKTAARKLSAVLIEKRYVSTLVRQPSGLFRYESVERRIEKKRESFTIPAAGREYLLPSDQPGEFELSIQDATKRVLTKVPYSVVGAANLAGRLERNAELEIELDKKDYRPGEVCQVSIRAPYEGAGLITIERDRVFAYKWFKSETKSSVQTIAIPKDIEANAYVNVAFTRKLDSSEVFMKPLAYAVAPFSIDRKQKVQEIELKVPEEVRPGQTLKIGYATRLPAKIVVFGVDEGILQVANYRTPDPLGHFLAKRALEVTTSQILDMVIPLNAPTFEKPSAEGGGDEGEEALGRNLNPFKRKREKPVVFWSGIVDADAEPKELTYDVPAYFNGTMRVMAVAVSGEQLGAKEQKTTIKGPFVIRPNTPLFATPGDLFEVNASVANNIEGSGEKANVRISLETSSNLDVVEGSGDQNISIPEGRERVVRFQVRARPPLGNASMVFHARHGAEKVDYETTLSVRPKTPFVTTLHAGVITGGKTSVPIERQLYRAYRKLDVAVSPVPLVLADGLSAYLEKFPHGCTEQIVSQTVPALVLGRHPEFGYDARVSKKAIARTVRLLGVRQNSDGAFGTWAANSHASDFHAVYAMQFLTEAKERGYQVSSSVFRRGLSYLRDLVGNDVRSISDARLAAYGIYILARNGKLAPGPLAALREYLGRDKDEAWKRDVTLVYLAATYALMR